MCVRLGYGECGDLEGKKSASNRDGLKVQDLVASLSRNLCEALALIHGELVQKTVPNVAVIQNAPHSAVTCSAKVQVGTGKLQRLSKL